MVRQTVSVELSITTLTFHYLDMRDHFVIDPLISKKSEFYACRFLCTAC